jgi:predicted DNA-binding transcriptional regulator YafY
MTAQQLAERLAVSVRTIQRDVEALIAAGVPIRGERGPAGGYRLPGGYRTRLTGLTKDEAEALFLAGVPGPAAQLGLGTVVADAQLKLLAALPHELRDRAERTSRLFHLDPTGWFTNGETTPAQLPELAGALWQGNRVDTRYRSRPHGSDPLKPARRVLDPLGLVLKAGVWYLVARSRDGLRVYRVSRFTSVKVRSEGFEPPADFDLADFWTERAAEFERTRPEIPVELRVRQDALGALRAAGDPTAMGEPDADGWLSATVLFERLEYAHRQLVQLGARVEVLRPAALRRRLAETGRELAELYSDERKTGSFALTDIGRPSPR